MKNCSWETIRSFSSMAEFKRFVKWIEHQLENGECIEVIEPIDSAMPLQSKKFRCLNSGEIWILSFPDPGYFSGSWEPVLE